LPFQRKGIADPRNRGRHIGGVQRRENQMAGFRGHHGDAHGFRIPHFSHNDDVRRLPQRGAQGRREIRSIRADLYLFDHAPQVLVLVLDGIFDGYDVPRLPQIDFMDERGKSGGLAGARRAADQHQSARQMGKVRDGRRQVQLRERRYRCGQGADRRRCSPAFAMKVNTETSQAPYPIGRVGDHRFPVQP
jgi:hypothetical protein